jgi:hypothetical protein
MEDVAAVELAEGRVARQLRHQATAGVTDVHGSILGGEEVERRHRQVRGKLRHARAVRPSHVGEDPLAIGERAALDVLAHVLVEPVGVLGALPSEFGLRLGDRGADLAIEPGQPVAVTDAADRRRILEHEMLDEIGVPGGDLCADGATEGVPDEQVRRRARRLDDRGDVIGEVADRRPAVEPRARPMAPQVDRDDPPATVRERRADAPPCLPPPGDAVDEDGERGIRSAVIRPLVRVEGDGAHCDMIVGHGRRPFRLDCGPMRSPPGTDRVRAGIPLWWLHPFLIAAFPVLFLFSQSINEQLSLDPLWAPLGLVILGTLILLVVGIGLGRLVGVTPARVALLVSLVVILLLTYGHVWNLVGDWLRLHRYLLIGWVVIGAIGTALLPLVPGRTIARMTTALTVAAALLVTVNLVPILGLAQRTMGAGIASTSAEGGSEGSADERDVWYLVFDRYAGEPTLSTLYDYDNAEFLNELRARGFAIADGATANYLKTALSLASSLNMEALDASALAAEATSGEDWTPLYRIIQRSHAVERFLHERGYRYVHLGVRRGATYANAAADVEILVDDTTEFSAVLADTTILAALENVVPSEVGLGTGAFYARQTAFQLDELDRLADLPGRNFIFAHILLPHPPYLFNADGSPTTPAQLAERTPEESYIEQLRYANTRILGLLDRLQDGPESSWPIVVLAADEGPFPDRYAADETGFAWEDATDEELLRKFSILATMLVPGVDAAGLDAAGFSDTITPENLFRVALNAAFDANLPLLDDRNWIFTDQRHIYDFVDVTGRVRAAVDAARATP